MNLKVLIADDEAPARRRLRRLLCTDPAITIAGECANGPATLDAVARLSPDLLVLDVQMPGADGLEVAAALPETDGPAVLFVTAFDEYAIRAFEIHAVDYLLKPFRAERLRTALARARQRIAARRPDPGLSTLTAALRDRRPWLGRLLVRSGARTIVVDVNTIDWMEAADNYVRLHVGDREYLARETLSALEAQLDPGRFVRVHRSALVQVDRVGQIRPLTHGDAELLLRNGTRLTVSRTWREAAQAALAQRMR